MGCALRVILYVGKLNLNKSDRQMVHGSTCLKCKSTILKKENVGESFVIG